MIPVRGFEGKTVAVFGLARTGLTAARALMLGGAEVAVWDERPESRAIAEAEGLPLVDLTTGAETSLTRGGAVHTTLDGAHTLALSDHNPTATGAGGHGWVIPPQIS